MLPQPLLLCSLIPGSKTAVGGRQARATLVPSYFNERDFPWISRFLAEFRRFEGKRRREAIAFFQGNLPFPAPEKKRALLLHWLFQESTGDRDRAASAAARRLRATVFEHCAEFPTKPQVTEVLSRISTLSCSRVTTLGTETPEKTIDDLFSDLSKERKLAPLAENLTPERISLSLNLALAQAFVARSSDVEIRAEGELRRIVRQAKLRRLICQAMLDTPAIGTRGTPPVTPLLRISGPLSLFGHTRLYGRSLAELIPLLAWCNRFELSAICRVRGKDALFHLRSGDPFLPADEPLRFDSRQEERFARDLTAASPDWELIREPEPIPTSASSSGTMIFPDFLIRHRRAPELHFYLEIIGYWTVEYLTRKLESLRGAKIENLILCVDESLVCDDSEEYARLKTLGELVLYRKTIPIPTVLARMERSLPTSAA